MPSLLTNLDIENEIYSERLLLPLNRLNKLPPPLPRHSCRRHDAAAVVTAAANTFPPSRHRRRRSNKFTFVVSVCACVDNVRKYDATHAHTQVCEPRCSIMRCARFSSAQYTTRSLGGQLMTGAGWEIIGLDYDGCAATAERRNRRTRKKVYRCIIAGE